MPGRKGQREQPYPEREQPERKVLIQQHEIAESDTLWRGPLAPVVGVVGAPVSAGVASTGVSGQAVSADQSTIQGLRQLLASPEGFSVRLQSGETINIDTIRALFSLQSETLEQLGKLAQWTASQEMRH